MGCLGNLTIKWSYNLQHKLLNEKRKMKRALRFAPDKLGRDADSSMKVGYMTRITLQKPDFVNSNEV